MNREDLFKIGLMPVISGPDHLAMCMNLIDPNFDADSRSDRQVTFIIDTPNQPPRTIEGSVQFICDGGGDDAYNVVLDTVNGSETLMCYSPSRSCVKSVISSSSLTSSLPDPDHRPRIQTQVKCTNNRLHWLNSLAECHRMSGASRHPLMISPLHRGEPVDSVTLIEKESSASVGITLHRRTKMKVDSMILDRSSRRYGVQLLDQGGRVFYGTLNEHFQLEFLSAGFAWGPSRLAS